MRRRRFTPEFKRSIIEQLLSETAGPAELCRRYNVSSGLLFSWKKQYAQGKLDSDPSREAELQARVAGSGADVGCAIGGGHSNFGLK